MSQSEVDLKEVERRFNEDKDAIKARGNALKFAVSGDGTFVDVSVEFQSQSFSIGKATSIKKGSGRFLVKHIVVGLGGAFRLRISDTAIKVYEDDEQIWFWAAEDEPEDISGDIDVVFDHRVIAALAALLATLY